MARFFGPSALIFQARLAFGLTGIDRGIGGAVDDDLRPCLGDIAVDTFRVADIDLRDVAAQRVVFFVQQVAAIRAKLSYARR